MIQVARSQVRGLLPLRCPSTSLPSRDMLLLQRFVPVRALVIFRACLVFGGRFVNRESVLLQ